MLDIITKYKANVNGVIVDVPYVAEYLDWAIEEFEKELKAKKNLTISDEDRKVLTQTLLEEIEEQDHSLGDFDELAYADAAADIEKFIANPEFEGDYIPSFIAKAKEMLAQSTEEKCDVKYAKILEDFVAEINGIYITEQSDYRTATFLLDMIDDLAKEKEVFEETAYADTELVGRLLSAIETASGKAYFSTYDFEQDMIKEIEYVFDEGEVNCCYDESYGRYGRDLLECLISKYKLNK